MNPPSPDDAGPDRLDPEASPPAATPGDPDPGFTGAEDEIVSAVLDDEATAEERTAVLGDDRFAARLEEFASARDRIASAAPVGEDDRERAIRAALAAGSVASIASTRAARTDAASGASEPDGEHPASQQQRAQQQASQRRRWAWTISAAAVVVIVAGIVFAGHREPADTSTSAASAGSESSKASGAGSAGDLSIASSTSIDSSTAVGPSTTVSPSTTVKRPSTGSRPRVVLQLGSFTSRAELVSTYSMAVAGRTLTPGPEAVVAPCPSSTDGLSEVASAALGTSNVLVGRRADGTVTVVDATTCVPVPIG